MTDIENLPSLNEIRAAAKSVALVCGIYFLFRDGKLLYIGQAINVMRRVGDHLASKQFDAYSYIEVEPARLSLVERMFILSLNPPLNQSINTMVVTRPGYGRERQPMNSAPLRLKNLLLRLKVSQKDLGRAIIQTHGPAKGRPLSISATSMLVNQNIWPSWTQAKHIKPQAESFLLSVGATENELEAIWEPEIDRLGPSGGPPTVRAFKARIEAI